MPDLADRVQFVVAGSQGVLKERERVQNFVAAAQFALQVAGFAAQMGKRVDIDFDGLIKETFNNGGIQNASRFVRTTEAPIAGPEGQPTLPDSDGTGAADPLAALQTFGETAA